MKETFYFSHDYNASQDPKILNMMAELGVEGYGLFWLVIEKLAEANGRLLLDDLKGLAFAWKIDCSKLDLLCSKFNLFTVDDQYFYSGRLLEHLKHRNNLSKVRAKMGRIGGLAKAKQMLSKCQANAKQNVAKESKVKESKVKESKGIQKLPNLSINKMIEILLSFNGLSSLDGTEQENRRYCWLLIKNKIKPEFIARRGQMPSDDEVVASLTAILRGADNFQKKKLTNFKYLYYNFGEIIKTAAGNQIIKI